MTILVVSGLAIESRGQDGRQKIGYVDSEYILEKIPDFSGISEQMRILAQQWRDELNKQEAEIDNLRKDFQAKEILYTPEIRKQKQDEIDQKVAARTRYRESKFGPEGDYFRRQQDLLQPLQKRILEAINRVAARSGYDFVFDRSGDFMFLYTRSNWNLSDEVLEELGITIQQQSN